MWLATRRRLELHAGAVMPAQVPWVYLGYRVSPAGLAASRKLRRRLKGRVRLAASRGPQALLRCLRSYRGLLG